MGLWFIVSPLIVHSFCEKIIYQQSEIPLRSEIDTLSVRVILSLDFSFFRTIVECREG